ncbi:hypothetical protein EBZ80_26095, partial [bacterium]|nr:hypothetical protein [bacterium]
QDPEDAIPSTLIVHPTHDADVVHFAAHWPVLTKRYTCIVGAYPMKVSDVLFASGRTLGEGVRERRLIVKRGDRFVGFLTRIKAGNEQHVQRLSLLQPSSFDEWLRIRA